MIALGGLVARLAAIRRLSLAIAAMIHAGLSPRAEAAMMKAMGTQLEQDIPETARLILHETPDLYGSELAAILAQTILNAPAFSLRGGTREILQGIVARELAA